MPIKIRVAVLAVAIVSLPGARAAEAQQNVAIPATVKSAVCTFSTLATGTWKEGKPEASVKTANLSFDFDSINVDEGTAHLPVNPGGDASASDIVVRLTTGGALHFVQMFTDGPLYTTTIFPNETRA